MTKGLELSADNLCFNCDEKLFNFATTDSVPSLDVMIGQERAVKAVEFGLFTKNPEYNIFISGLVGTGKITYAQTAVKKAAEKESVPGDWCYVNNFKNPGQPIVLFLPPGLGSIFRQDMQDLVEDLKTETNKVFSSDDYEQAKSDTVKKFQDHRDTMLETFNERAEELGIMPQWTTTSFAGLPMRDGKPITPEEFQKLEKDEREELEKNMLVVHNKAMDVIHQLQHLERNVREELKNLDARVGLFAVGHLIEELRKEYAEYIPVVEFLEAVQKDIVKNINDYKPSVSDDEQNPLALFKKNTEPAKKKYKINLLVDNKDTQGAPVVVETNPTYYNLIGRVEYETKMGMVSTNYMMIKAGALHRANGGYLILNARDVLTNVGAWEGLKRVLKTRKMDIENLGEQYGLLAMASLKPESIPFDVKIILIGNPSIYHMLYAYDEDFRKLFKVNADFDVEMFNNPENISKYAGFISSTISREGLKHFDRSAVARVVEHASRIAGTQKKLTTKFNEVVELLCEADIWAKVDGSATVGTKHIKQAISEKKFRASKHEDHLQEMFANGTLLMDTDNEVIGQLNGLAVLSVGDYMFGKPSRITANTYLGKSGIINIERETKMSGTSHSKGMLNCNSKLN